MKTQPLVLEDVQKEVFIFRLFDVAPVARTALGNRTSYAGDGQRGDKQTK